MCSLMPLYKDPQMVMKNNLPPKWKPQLGKVIITFLDAGCPHPEPFALDRKGSGGHRGHPEKTSTKPAASPRSRSWETPQGEQCYIFGSSQSLFDPNTAEQKSLDAIFSIHLGPHDHHGKQHLCLCSTIPGPCLRNGTVLLQIPAYLTSQHQRGIKLVSGSSKTKYPQREMKDFREGGKQLAR